MPGIYSRLRIVDRKNQCRYDRFPSSFTFSARRTPRDDIALSTVPRHPSIILLHEVPHLFRPSNLQRVPANVFDLLFELPPRIDERLPAWPVGPDRLNGAAFFGSDKRR